MKLTKSEFETLMYWFRNQNIFLLDLEHSSLFNIENISDVYLYDNLVINGIGDD